MKKPRKARAIDQRTDTLIDSSKNTADVFVTGEPSISAVRVEESIIQSSPYYPSDNTWGALMHRHHGPVLLEGFLRAAATKTFPRMWETDSIWRSKDPITTSLRIVGPSNSDDLQKAIRKALADRTLPYDSYEIKRVARVLPSKTEKRSDRIAKTFRIKGTRHAAVPKKPVTLDYSQMTSATVLVTQYNCLSTNNGYLGIPPVGEPTKHTFEKSVISIEDRRPDPHDPERHPLLDLFRDLVLTHSLPPHLNPENSVIQVKADMLRSMGYPISQNLSWERTCQTIIETVQRIGSEVNHFLACHDKAPHAPTKGKSLALNGVAHRHALDYLSTISDDIKTDLDSKPWFLYHFRHIVVSMSPDAAVYLTQDKGIVNAAWLYCDPKDIEGGLFARTVGKTRAYDTAVLASIGFHVATNENQEDGSLEDAIRKGIENGLVGARYMHFRGFTPVYQAAASKVSLLSDSDATPEYILEPGNTTAPQGQSHQRLYYPIDPVGHIIRRKSVDDITWIPSEIFSLTNEVREAWTDRHEEASDDDKHALVILLSLLALSLALPATRHRDTVGQLLQRIGELGIVDITNESGQEVVKGANPGPFLTARDKLMKFYDPERGADYRRALDLIESYLEHSGEVVTSVERYAGLLSAIETRFRRIVQDSIKDLTQRIRLDFEEAKTIKGLCISSRVIKALQSRREDSADKERRNDGYLLNSGYFDSTWWSFLGEVVRSEVGSSREDGEQHLEEAVMHSLAASYLLEGREGVAHKDLVRAEYGSFVSYNRSEIEGIRGVASIIRTYLSRDTTAKAARRPLNIGVFGPPGAGKGYAVDAVIRSLNMPEIAPEHLTFNLSQFRGADEIFQALNRVRDVSIKGSVPLVFWDEYDTTFDGVPFGWLRYFLGPMWEGEFQEGQITRPIGRAIFVFAGSRFTSQLSLEVGLILDREGLLPKKGESPEELALFHDFKSAKGMDFKSRLLAYVDIMDVNPVMAIPEVLDFAQLQLNKQRLSIQKRQQAVSDFGLGRHLDPGWRDYYLLRRALQVRSELSLLHPLLLNDDSLSIDGKVMDAFLQARRYHHGARSLSALLQMSSLDEIKKFDMAALPGGELMRLHVEPAEMEGSYEARS